MMKTILLALLVVCISVSTAAYPNNAKAKDILDEAKSQSAYIAYMHCMHAWALRETIIFIAM